MSGTNGSSDLETMLGDPRRAVRRMSIPLIVSFLIVQINTFADSAWVAGLGTDASSAVTVISPVYWILNGIGMGVGIGASTVIARHLARGENGRGDHAAGQAIVFSLLVSILCIPASTLLISPLVSFMGADDVMGDCIAYMLPMTLLCTFNILCGTMSEVVSSEGATRKTMILMGSSAAINIVLDPILIYTLDMGVAGAGLATAVSTIPACVICLWWFRTGRTVLHPTFKGYRPDMDVLKGILQVGLPRAGEYTVIYLMAMIQRIFIIVAGGTEGVALYSMTWSYVSMSNVIAMGIGAALVPICSAALGCRRLDKALDAYWYSMRLCLVVMTVLAIVLFVFAEWVVIPFTYTGSMMELRPEFVWVLRLYSLFVPVIGFIELGSCMLQAMRHAKASLASSFIRNMMIVSLMAITCGIGFHETLYGLAFSEFFGAALMTGLVMLYIREYRRMVPG